MRSIATVARSRLLVLIPAHNEQDGIGKTLQSLHEQSWRPSDVVVVADNCTDNTARIARGWGTRVVETVDNTAKKAGALNQALSRLLPALSDQDKILVMDADSTLNPQFIENALAAFAKGKTTGAVSSTFFGEAGGGFVGFLQRMEYEQYAFELRRRRDTLVLSGTATIFR